MFGKRSSNGAEQVGPAEALPPAPAPVEVPSKGIEVGRAPLPSAGLGAPIMSPPLAPNGRDQMAMPAPTATN